MRGGVRAFVDVAAVQAPPLDRPVTLERAAVVEAFQQAAVAPLVLLLGHGDLLEGDGDGRKPLLPGNGGEAGIHDRPFFMFAVGRRQQVLGGSPTIPAGNAHRS